MNPVLSALDDLGIEYVVHEHEPFFTCEEAQEFYENVEGGNSKNLFLRNRKGEKHYLFILEWDKQADLKAVV